MARVAVIILNWNGEKLLREFLPSVVKYTDPGLGRIVVADNASEDDSVRIVSGSGIDPVFAKSWICRWIQPGCRFGTGGDRCIAE